MYFKITSWERTGRMTYIIDKYEYIVKNFNLHHKDKIDIMLKHDATGRVVNYLKKFKPKRLNLKVDDVLNTKNKKKRRELADQLWEEGNYYDRELMTDYGIFASELLKIAKIIKDL